jgi:hypothetical protein
MASAELLRVRPQSGQFPERQFDAFGNTTWVKFTDDAFEEWCGVFGAGTNAASAVTCASAGAHAFIVSAGQGYFVDMNSRTLLHKTHSDRITHAAFIPGSGRVVACDWTHLFVLGVDGSVWDSGRVSFDGISFTEVTVDHVIGRVNDLSDDGVEFCLRLSPIHYDCSWKFGK